MPQRVVEKAANGWDGLNSHRPPHLIGDMQAQSCQNCHLDSGRLEKGRGFRKVRNVAQYQPCLFFPDPNAGRNIEDPRNIVGRVPYVRVPHNSDFDPTDRWTLEFIIRFDANVQDSDNLENCIISKGDKASLNRTVEAYLDSTKNIRMEFDISGVAQTLTSTTSLSFNTTYHIALRRAGNLTAILIDGVVDNTGVVGSGNTDTNTQPFIFGMRLRDLEPDGNFGSTKGHGQDYYHGFLDEVRWWRTDRSDAQILSNFDRELDSTDVTSLVGYWKFNEGKGLTSACDPNVSGASAKTAELRWSGPQYVTGLVDENEKGAWDFDGYADSAVVVVHDAGPVFTAYKAAFEDSPQLWTVEVNVVLDDVSRDQTILFMGNETDPTGSSLAFHLQFISGTGFRFTYHDVGGAPVINVDLSSLAVNAGDHYHLAFGHVSINNDIFLRGWNITKGPDEEVVSTVGTGFYQEESATTLGAPGVGITQDMTVGMLGKSRGSGAAFPMDGRIDEIRFWNVDRRDIQGLDYVLRFGNSKLNGDEDGLIGYWPLDDTHEDYLTGDPLSSAGRAKDLGNSIRGFPNSLPPQWTNGLLSETRVDSDGTTLLNPPVEITSILSFNETDEPEEILYSAGCNLYRLGQAGFDEIRKNLRKNELLSWSIYSDNVYYTSSNNLPLAYIKGEVFYMGVPRPFQTPLVEEDSGVLGFTNKRGYVFTYYDERTGAEGSASPVAIIDHGSNQYGTKVFVWPSSDPRVTHIRVYATLSAPQEVGTNFYRLAEIQNPGTVQQGVLFPLAGAGGSTAYTVLDSTSDAQLQLQAPLTLIADPPRRSKYLQSYMDRMYFVDQDKPNRLYFSSIGNPDSVNALSFQNYEENEGDEITAIATVRSKLVIGKDTSVWEQPVGEGGQLSLPLKPRVRHRDHGIVSHWSVANLDDNLIVYLNSKGFFVYDGQQHNYISEDIEDQVQNLNDARLKLSYAGHYRQRWEYMCSVSTEESDVHDVVWAFYYRGQGGGSWIKKTDFNATVLAGLRNIRNRSEQFLIGTRFGYLMLYDNGVSDAQSNYGAGGSGSLTGTSDGGTTSTIGDSSAGWDTINDGLKGVPIVITDADDGTTHQATIIDNTSNNITFFPVRSSAVVAGDTYKIARIPFEWQSRDEILGDSVREDRWVFLDAHHGQQSAGKIAVDFEPDRGSAASPVSRLMDVSTRRRSRLLINRRATLMSVKFSDDTPNEVKDIESYAWTVVTGGKAPDPART